MTDIFPVAELEPGSAGDSRQAGLQRTLAIACALLLIVSTAAALVQLRADNRSPKQRLAAAQDAVADAKSFKFEMTMSSSSATANFDARAAGEIDTVSQQGSLTLSMPGRDLHLLVDENRAYMAVPEDLRPRTGGKPFASWQVNASTTGANPTGVGAVNPLDTFAKLDAISAPVAEVGSEEVRGAVTTHFRTEVDFLKLAERDKAASDKLNAMGPDARAMLERLRHVPVDVWLDDANRPRRYTMRLQMGTAAAGLGHMTFTISIETFDYGKSVSIDIPKVGDVFETDEQFIGRFLSGS
jgi:hypothetical protein